jgi:iron only hydrogenase large subunit-like protein/uncharacterized Fe-S cluster-containing protein
MLDLTTGILKLKKSNCKNCYKCIRNCPVDSIRFSENQAHIIGSECILCGQCFVVCPQNAKEIRDDADKARALIKSGAPVVVSLAPSYAANYHDSTCADLTDALCKLGFSSVEETAIGATIVKRRYEKILAEDKPDVLISSCCHTVNLLIEKHYPEALPYLAQVISPMQAHCLDIKRRIPQARTVFIGPCISKKDEAEQVSNAVDCVLTFEELGRWLEQEKINVGQSVLLSSSEDLGRSLKPSDGRARFFPTAGGIIRSMETMPDSCSYLAIDGMDNCIAAIREIITGGLHDTFVEMSACTGSCIGGPVMDRNQCRPIQKYSRISSVAGHDDFMIEMPEPGEIRQEFRQIEINNRMPDEIEIKAILRQIGKTKPEHELNCGSCGYDTCRQKAIAVYQGKADLNMCLPYLKEKAESFSDNIINNTPNGIIVVNDNYQVQQINNAALRLMNIRRAEDVLGEQVVRIMDPKPFMDVLRSGHNIHGRRTWLAEYEKYVEKSIILDREFNLLICIMHDVTDEEMQRERKESIRHQTIDIADKVVEKQMRIVQEIASLLGETTAETKIALTKLKESISDE